MLKRKYKLPAKEIPKLARKGVKFGSELLQIRFIGDESIEYPKSAIVISKKVDRRAVARNRIKRRLRVSIDELAENSDLKLGKYLFLVKSNQLLDKNLNISSLIMSILK